MKKHPRIIFLALLCFGFFCFIKSKDVTVSRNIASIEDKVTKKLVPKENPVFKSSSLDTSNEEDLKEKEEHRKKREARYAKIDECHQFEEDLKRPERDNFRRKVLSVVSSDIGEWLYNKQRPSQEIESVSTTDKIFRAVALSGLAKRSEYFNFPADIPTALKLADEVITADPTNSAGYLLKARLLDTENKTDEARKILDVAEEKTDHFDTGMMGIMQKMIRVTDGAADMLLGFELQTPLLVASSLAISMIRKYKKIKLAEQIMKPAYDNSKLINEFEWSSWDYQNAKYALEDITGKKFPDHMEIHPMKEKILAQQFPEFDPSKRSESERDPDGYECQKPAELERGLFLVKKALARAK